MLKKGVCLCVYHLVLTIIEVKQVFFIRGGNLMKKTNKIISVTLVILMVLMILPLQNSPPH